MTHLEFVIIADKGEMACRVVREVADLKMIPIVLFSKKDDSWSLQVRLAENLKGYSIGLDGDYREAYANYVQIVEKIKAFFKHKFEQSWKKHLDSSALYPGYGPLAENSDAIDHFRKHGILFIGPTQQVVEEVGDKRSFRKLIQRISPHSVTPGLIVESSDLPSMVKEIGSAWANDRIALPARLKAAHGGGGRGQIVITSITQLPKAINNVLSATRVNGWRSGLIFEENISGTTHLEVQILRDQFGNTRHLGMRDCSEQRGNQKLQEEAPPAYLKDRPHVREELQNLAVRIAEEVGYVGAGTVELMCKGDRFYFLEMNPRIQVEHPVTECSHRIARSDGTLQPLNLIQWQLKIAEGKAIDFLQSDVVPYCVAREFRINSESWRPDIKDRRDGEIGLFLPHSGVFDQIRVPSTQDVLDKLNGNLEIEHLTVRFDCGFEPGDVLVNKDPMFGKLIVGVRTYNRKDEYETLRKVSLTVLKNLKITGKEILPDKRIVYSKEGGGKTPRPFQNNIGAHIRILESELFKLHCSGIPSDRHVNWVIEAFRKGSR